MFRSLSHQLHGTKDKHNDVHLVQKVMEENMEKYNNYSIQIETTFSQHVQLIKNQGDTSSCLPTSNLCAASSSGTYKWHVFKPEPKRQPTSISLPPNTSLPFTKDHIEIAHSTDHYDNVPSAACLSPLTLPLIITQQLQLD